MPSHFVPVPSGRGDCSIVLPTVDKQLYVQRTLLSSALASGDSTAITDGFVAYEATVVEANAVYLCLDAVQSQLTADLGPPSATVCEYISHLLDTRDHPLATAFSLLGSCEPYLGKLVGVRREAPIEFTNAMTKLADALEQLRAQIHKQANEFVKPFLTCDRMSSPGWRTHGFQLAAGFDTHHVGQIPASTQNYLAESSGHAPTRGSAMMRLGWDYLNTLPVGVRLGMVARYCGAGGMMAGLFLYEQLLIKERLSLLDQRLCRRLRVLCHDKPNAQLPTDMRIPLVAIMYSVVQQSGLPCTSEIDLQRVINSERSAPALRTAVQRWLGQLVPNACVTADETTWSLVPHTNTFLGLSRVWTALVGQITLDTEDLDVRCASSTENQRSLYLIIRTLYAVRSNGPALNMLARVLWWSRYVRRGRANEQEFWYWEPDHGRILDDLAAFSVSGSLFGGRTWNFNSDSVSAT